MSARRVSRRLIHAAPARVGLSIVFFATTVLVCYERPELLSEPTRLVLLELALFATTLLGVSGLRRLMDRFVPSEQPLQSSIMEPVVKGKSADIEQRAAEWLVHLDSAGSPERWAAVDAWLAANPRHRAAFLRLAVAWGRADVLRRLRFPDSDTDPDRLRELRARTARHPRRTCRLPDGSTVWVAAGGDVRLLDWNRARRVHLVDGNAVFQVRGSSDVPFEVVTVGALIRVTGTLFAVRAGGAARLEIVVASGEIEVTPTVRDEADTATHSRVVSPHHKAVLTLGRLEVSPASRLELWTTFGLRLARGSS